MKRLLAVAIAVVLMVGAGVGPAMVWAGVTTKQWKNDPAYQVKPGYGVGEVRVGESSSMLVEQLTPYESQPAQQTEKGTVCSEPEEHICAMYDEKTGTVYAVVTKSDSDYWVQAPGDTLHELSAGGRDLVALYGRPDKAAQDEIEGQPVIIAAWCHAGLAAVLYADSDTNMIMALAAVAKDGCK